MPAASKRHTHHGRKRVAGNAALYALLVLGALATLVPLGWMVAASFMVPGEANSLPPRLLPAHPTLQNYVVMFTRLDLMKHFLNSAIVTTLATLLSVLVNSLAGYAFGRRPGCAGASGHAAAVPAAEADGPGQYVCRRAGAVPGEHLRHLHDPSVCAERAG
jgi:ABC-type spermidine/putrescine transport system permease subunit II